MTHWDVLREKDRDPKSKNGTLSPFSTEGRRAGNTPSHSITSGNARLPLTNVYLNIDTSRTSHKYGLLSRSEFTGVS